MTPLVFLTITELPDRRQILQVVGVGVLGGFENEGQILQLRVIHDAAKRRQADVPLADVPMAVHPGIERHLGIVEMDQLQMLPSHNAVKRGHDLLQSFLRMDREACREEVRGIQADADIPLRANGVTDSGQFFKRHPEPLTRPGRVLQQNHRGWRIAGGAATIEVAAECRTLWAAGERLRHRPGDPGDAGRFPCSPVAADMRHQVLGIERRGAGVLVTIEGDRACPHRRLR